MEQHELDALMDQQYQEQYDLSAIDAEVDSYFESGEEEREPKDKPPFSIDDMDIASWASRKLANAYRSLREIDEFEQREIERVKAAAERARSMSRLPQTIEFFTVHLALYLKRLLEAGRKSKSLPLPGGVISSRAGSERVIIEDEDKAVAWLKDHGYADLIRTKETVDKTALKKVLKTNDNVSTLDTGEVIEVAHIERGDDSIKFTPVE